MILIRTMKDTLQHYIERLKKYGKDSFIIELLEECEVTLLNERECFWINKLDTFKNGYNMTLGGEGSNRIELPEEAELRELSCKMTITQLARHYGVYAKTVYSWLDRYDIKEIKTHKRRVATLINGVEYSFESLSEAGQWLIDNGFTNNKQGKRSVASFITKSIEENKKYLGFSWYFV